MMTLKIQVQDPMLTKVLFSNMDPNKSLHMDLDQELLIILTRKFFLIKKSARAGLIRS